MGGGAAASVNVGDILEREHPVRILHLHSSFSLGGKEARAVRLMNLMEDRAQHTILSAVPDALGAREAIAPGIDVRFPTDAPSLTGWPSPFRYEALARYMLNFDLVLSYNWGAMDGAMAHRLYWRRWSHFVPPNLVHHEDGFNEDESVKRSWKRNLFRRHALASAGAVVVPSSLLARIAATEWKIGGRVKLIPNGIDVAAYAGAPTVALPGFERRPAEVVIGTVAGLRRVKDIPRLVRAMAALPGNVRLVIVGEGPERPAIEAEAVRCGVADRVVLAGFMPDPAHWIGHFDMLALSSLSEQAPIAVIEAMAAGLPVVSLDVGDASAMVAPINRPFVAADEMGFRAALARMAAEAGLRAEVGAANRGVAAERFDESIMVAAYQKLYARAMEGYDVFTGRFLGID